MGELGESLRGAFGPPPGQIIDDMFVEKDFVSSDHLPLGVQFKIHGLFSEHHQDSSAIQHEKISWSNLNKSEINQYCELSRNNLSNIQIDIDLMSCTDLKCHNKVHHLAIDRMYSHIISGLKEASEKFVQNKKVVKCRTVPGWNDYVRESHSEARDAFVMWQQCGKPRYGPICDIMKRTRARFIYCLRHCKAIETRAKADSLAKTFLSKDTVSFWRDIKYINNSGSSTQADTIGEAVGEKNITAMWFEHYKSLLNLKQNTSAKKNEVLEMLSSRKFTAVKFEVGEVSNVIKSLKRGKSAGTDQLQAEHFIYAYSSISVLLCMLLNSCMSHGYIPQKLMETVIVPILKDSKGLVTDKDNYRPVAVTNVASKVFELLLLRHLQDLLYTENNQFGFKPKHGTDMAVFTLKQIIEFYTMHGSPTFVCYIDASKAFDRISHWCLFDKLLKRGVDVLFVRILIYWYSNQLFCVKWGSHLSDFFGVSNGVRQGGIMSPYLFNVYMNELSIRLNNSKCGCIINGMFMNHIMYADDACVLAPSPTALQKLLNICDSFAKENCIVYNEKKSKCMVFKPKGFKVFKFPSLYLNKKALEYISCHKYLGIIISDDMSDDKDISRQIRALYIRGNMLCHKFKQCTPEIKRTLFRTYCTSNYGCELWTMYSRCKYKEITVAYNNIFRKLMNIQRGTSISTEFVKANVNPLKVIIRKCTGSIRKRLYSSDNAIVQAIMTSHFNMCGSITTKEWNKVLFRF